MEPVTYICYLSLKINTFPADWKVHKICPIPKKGDLCLVKNYRPISLLPILSKVLESIVYKKIIDFIRPQLNNHQFGFLKNRSCLSEMLAFFSNIFQNIEKKKPSDIVYLDFSKAFDTVPHDELLLKLWRIGITGSLWYRMKSYLSNRHHYTCIRNSCSTRLPVRSGVPQGSVLGPLLFLVFINDLPESIHSAGTFIFADDTKLVKCIDDSVSQQLLQDDLNNLSTWCNTLSLALNPVKCSVLRVSLSPSLTTPPVYTILNVSLCSVSKQRDLGILVKNDLTWSDHYNYISSKAYRSLNLIRRTISVSSSTKTKKSLYLSLVRSQLTYCSQLWRPNMIKDIKRLETIQRCATKFIMSNTSTSYRDRLQSLYILPLMYWLEIETSCF